MTPIEKLDSIIQGMNDDTDYYEQKPQKLLSFYYEHISKLKELRSMLDNPQKPVIEVNQIFSNNFLLPASSFAVRCTGADWIVVVENGKIKIEIPHATQYHYDEFILSQIEVKHENNRAN